MEHLINFANTSFTFLLKGEKSVVSHLSGTSCKNDIITSIAAAAAKSLQSCPTLCDPVNGSPPGSSVPGILPGKNTGVILKSKQPESL